MTKHTAIAAVLTVTAVGIGVGAGVIAAHPLTSTTYTLSIPAETQQRIEEDRRSALRWAVQRHGCHDDDDARLNLHPCRDDDLSNVSVAFRPDVAELLAPVANSFDLPPVSEWAARRDALAQEAPGRAREVCDSWCGYCRTGYILPERSTGANWHAVVSAPAGSRQQVEARAAYLNTLYMTERRLPKGAAVMFTTNAPTAEPVTVVADTARYYILPAVLGALALGTGVAAAWAWTRKEQVA
ncbi:hypothetical protein [Mycobacterium servetii]|uniref:Uncharacterized protein n=1 Tax=Mycobacterium servetii TaxID=3237418 RepID=A0ABV4BV69_9MYCO